MSPKHLNQITHFIYEMGIHQRTPRSGLWFLGSGQQSVAEHLFRTTMIAYALCYLTPRADKHKVIFMALIHDIGEGRVSDLSYVHQRYGRLAEGSAVSDIAKSVPFGQEIEDSYLEEQAKISLESKLVKDADNLEWLATMREEEIKGNAKAKSWAKDAARRMKTPAGKAIAKLLLTTHPDDWWHDDKDPWWIDRNPTHQQWRKKPTTKAKKK